MNNKLYSPEQMADAVTMFDMLKSVPAERRFLLSLMMNAFVSGMEAQEKMNAQNKKEEAQREV